MRRHQHDDIRTHAHLGDHGERHRLHHGGTFARGMMAVHFGYHHEPLGRIRTGAHAERRAVPRT